MLPAIELALKKFHNKKILVLGIGTLGGGAGVANFFAKLGAKVTATDLKTEDELDRKQLRALKDLGVKLILGEHRKKDILTADLVIRNPAVPTNSSFLKLAHKRNIPVTMDEALFAQFCPVPIIGVTGTRGKTTTTFMTVEVLKEGGFHTLVGGNVKGTATLPLLWKLRKNTKIVLELSSWALEGFAWSKISPQIGIITNIYPDHLNRYSSMEEYVRDKEAIFHYQRSYNLILLNRQDPYSEAFAQKAPARVEYFSESDLPVDLKLNVPGVHNRTNAAAVLKLARSLGIADYLIRKGLEEFGGVPYRLQQVRTIKGVIFINDTTSTTPAACIAAVRTFSDRGIVLMIGGATKNLPLEDLVATIERSTVKDFVFLAGEGTLHLLEKLRKRNIIKNKAIVYSDLGKAVRAAQNKASDGDVILFSPAFTSFAMFKNEFDRGEKFNSIVNAL